MKLKTGMCCATCTYAKKRPGTLTGNPIKFHCSYHKDLTVDRFQWCESFACDPKILEEEQKKNKSVHITIWRQRRERAIRQERKKLEAKCKEVVGTYQGNFRI